MKYFSLDIETSSLTPHPANILSLALVFEDTENPLPLEQLPRLHVLLTNPVKDADNYAVALNRDLFLARDAVSKGKPAPEGMITAWNTNCSELKDFITQHHPSGRAVVAGKNVAGFDLKFLPEHVANLFAHRVLDPGSMYTLPTDKRPPDTAECCRRAGIDDTVTHNALDDALQVIALIRKHWGISV